MANRLGVKKIKAFKDPGMHSDGQITGLYLNVAETGSKSFIQRITFGGRRRDIGLGGYPSISLATAREWAKDNRSLVASGKEPLSAKDRRKVVPIPMLYAPTVRDIAGVAYEQAVEAKRWTHEKNVRAWATRYLKHVDPVIGETPIEHVDKHELRDLLAGILSRTPETGKAVKDILNLIFEHAVWEELIDANPVRQIPRGQLPSTPAQTHFKAMPFTQIADALHTLDKSDASLTNKLAIRLLALTAVRSRSVRLATWDQFDLEDAVWYIPETLMKDRKKFRALLSSQSLAVLRVAKALNPDSDLVFPNGRGNPFSDSAYSKLFRELAIPATPHGFRSSFSEWGHRVEQADFAVVEHSLAHVVGGKVTRAYLRSDYWEERRVLMQKWGDCIGDSTIFGVDAVNMKGGEASRPSRESGRPWRGRMSVGHGTERIASAPPGDEPRADAAIAADS